MMQQRAQTSRSEVYRKDALDFYAMRMAKPLTAINFIHGIFCYTLLADFFPNISSGVLVLNTTIAGLSIIALSTKMPIFLVPNILAKVAIIIFLPLFTLPVAGVTLSLSDTLIFEKLDVGLLVWLAIALICFVIENHIMFCCFMYLFRTQHNLKRQSDEDDSDEPPPYMDIPPYAIAIHRTLGFYPSHIECPPYSIACASTGDGGTALPVT